MPQAYRKHINVGKELLILIIFSDLLRLLFVYFQKFPPNIGFTTLGPHTLPHLSSLSTRLHRPETKSSARDRLFGKWSVQQTGRGLIVYNGCTDLHQYFLR